jgi:DNA-binding Lrp family transcriptional regulator
LENAAKDWYKTIYLPFVAMIEHSRLAEAFPKRTIADLYAYISFHQWRKGRKRKYGIGLDQLIPKSMEEFRAKMAEKKEFELPEMKRVITAFLLISVETGREGRIIDKLFACQEVQEIHFVPGEFDIIVKIVVEHDWLSSDSEIVGQFLHDNVRSISGVSKTQTIIPISSKQKKEPAR